MARCCGAGGCASPVIVRVMVMVVGGWRELVACCGVAGGRSPSIAEGGDGKSSWGSSMLSVIVLRRSVATNNESVIVHGFVAMSLSATWHLGCV